MPLVLPILCCPTGGKTPTPHHIVLKSQFKMPGKKGKKIKLRSKGKYKASKAPCVCVSGESHSEGDHGVIHSATNKATRASVGVASGKQIPATKRWSVGAAEKVGAQAVEDATGCPAGCIEDQVRKGHDAQGVKAGDQIRPTTAGGEESNSNEF